MIFASRTEPFCPAVFMAVRYPLPLFYGFLGERIPHRAGGALIRGFVVG